MLGKGAQLKQKYRDGEILVLWEQISLAITERSCQRNYRQKDGTLWAVLQRVQPFGGWLKCFI